MPRIIAGQWRGRVIKAPEGGDTRPTGERAREALMSMLAADLSGARALDLFAGSGALGLEALSRGAASAVFVDASRKASAILASNIALLGAGERSRLLTMDALAALRVLAADGDRFDIVFIDPPYARDLYRPALELLLRRGLIHPGGIACVESQAPVDAPGYRVLKDKRYGRAHIRLITPDAADTEVPE